jgi:L-2-hydroxyglutarate oxidase
MYDIAIIGGGIIGLTTAYAVLDQYPNVRLIQIEKEATWAAHQTGRNSGVLHSGIYYQPDSLKARLCREGNESMIRFCQEHGVAFEVCGKLIVATEDSELAELEKLHQRGLANGIPVQKMTAAEVTEREPFVEAKAGLHVSSTGITDFQAVCDTLARLLQEKGAELRLETEVLGTYSRGHGRLIETTTGPLTAGVVVNCAGLQSDRVALASGYDPKARIMPFRGEYYELVPSRRHLIKNLVYPVPNPLFPFLGVHFTRMIDGSIHAGPNAVLALKREGYRKRDVSMKDTAELVRFPGFRRLARRHGTEGAKEVWRSLSKSAFTRSLQRLVPDVQAEDLVTSAAGVRAQAVNPDGSLVDDFLVITSYDMVHVCNAPSPAATSSLAIGRDIATRIPALPTRRQFAFS